MVEAVRVGTVIAHDRKAYQRWSTRRRTVAGRSTGGGLVGEALERAVMGLAARNPEYVVVGA